MKSGIPWSGKGMMRLCSLADLSVAQFVHDMGSIFSESSLMSMLELHKFRGEFNNNKIYIVYQFHIIKHIFIYQLIKLNENCL